jgi:radical SAM superfamily enzyme YgiQ (UPF0313 family)
MRYEGDIYRPPSEARSYLLQCTIGCSHNQCTFCGMYKNKKYRVREMDEIMIDIGLAALHYPQTEKVFLCDGDALAMPTSDLVRILTRLYESFPRLKHVGIYAGPKSILDKKGEELRDLHRAGLTLGYLGVESGDDEVLKKVKKGVRAAEMIEAGRKFRAAGLKLSCMIILGLAGREGSLKHARTSGILLSTIDPEYIAALTLTVRPDTKLAQQVARGEFVLPDQWGFLMELKELVRHLTVKNCLFRSNHASNYLPIGGHLPEDKERIIALLEGVIAARNQEYLRPEYLRGY